MEYAEYVEQATTEVREQTALENATANEKIIGEFLIEQFKDEEMCLAKPFMEKKCRLNEIWSKVVKKAEKHLNKQSGAVSDETVYGWVCEIIIGEGGTKPKTIKKPAQPAKRVKVAKSKEKPHGEFKQMSLFEDFGIPV